MNHSDAERVKAVLEKIGYKEETDLRKANLVIFVTCSIKQKAEDKVIGHFRELELVKRKNKNLKIGMTGCMARITGNQNSPRKDYWLKKLNDLDFVFRIEDTHELPNLLENEFVHESNKQSTISYFEIKPSYKNNFQAYVPIMTGCNKFCTYCIVPYSRGREFSRSVKNIIEEITDLIVNKKYKEITLLGQNVNSFGRTNNVYCETYKENHLEPFARLLTEIDAIEGKFRVRFTSPHPHDMTDQVIETICALKTQCNHVHLPLQSGSDAILKKMNRTYNVEKFYSIVKKFRKLKPDISISTDIIVGFCGETKKQFNETVDTFKKIKFDLAYISPYSTRKGTYADKMLKDNVSNEEKKERFHVLNNVLCDISYEKNKTYAGKIMEVLVETIDQENKLAIGKTSCYKTVHIPQHNYYPGDWVMVEIIDAKEWMLEGWDINLPKKISVQKRSIRTSKKKHIAKRPQKKTSKLRRIFIS